MTQRISFPHLLMTLSACLMAVGGVLLSFLPAEILTGLEAQALPSTVLLLQAYGAALLGFAMVNWMSRGMTFGGIYGRPLVVGNLMHFGAGGIGALKLLLAHPEAAKLWPLGGSYAVLAVCFAVVMMRPPRPKGA